MKISDNRFVSKLLLIYAETEILTTSRGRASYKYKKLFAVDNNGDNITVLVYENSFKMLKMFENEVTGNVILVQNAIFIDSKTIRIQVVMKNDLFSGKLII